MPGKFSTLLQSNKFLFLVFGLSILMLIVGVILINKTPDTAPEAISPAVPQQDDLSLIKSLDDTEAIINNASQSNTAGLLGDQRQVRGSEEWCEAMMVKPNAEWNDPDTRLFAQKCLND